METPNAKENRKNLIDERPLKKPIETEQRIGDWWIDETEGSDDDFLLPQGRKGGPGEDQPPYPENPEKKPTAPERPDTGEGEGEDPDLGEGEDPDPGSGEGEGEGPEMAESGKYRGQPVANNIDAGDPIIKARMILYDTVRAALNRDIAALAPKERTTRQWHSEQEVLKYLRSLRAAFHPISPSAIVIATVLLFNKGAANKGTPTGMAVQVAGVEITKADLMYHYKKEFGSTYIRRMAESMSDIIGVVSEKHNLQGDLARKINQKLSQKGEPPLTARESAWASSFHQGNDGLRNVSERLPKLLAEDYSDRFSGRKKQAQENANTKTTKTEKTEKEEGSKKPSKQNKSKDKKEKGGGKGK